jgi:hypothetical protein
VQQISILSDWMMFYFFFALGDLVSKLFFKDNFQKVLKSPYTFLATIPLFIISQMYFINHDIDSTSTHFLIQSQFIIIAVIGCFSMFVLAFLVQRLNILAFLRIVGYHSLYIYVMHVMIAACARIVLTKFFGIYNTEVLLLTGIFFGVTASIILYNIFIRNGIFWFLFTYKKPKSKPPATTVKKMPPAAIAS